MRASDLTPGERPGDVLEQGLGTVAKSYRARAPGQRGCVFGPAWATTNAASASPRMKEQTVGSYRASADVIPIAGIRREIPLMLLTSSFALGFIAATVVIQALFMSWGLRVIRWMEKNHLMVLTNHPTLATVILIAFLIVPITLDVTLWATFYYFHAALPGLEESLYFSIATF